MRSSRYHIQTHTAPPPLAGYPADFLIAEGDTYVKYGHPVFEGRAQRGDDYWTAEIITQTWYQAETGRIPISGAGYGGKFAGEGFEGLWLDMSEIVRPTRDGIHGREYISTQVDIGAGLERLVFEHGKLASALPPSVQPAHSDLVRSVANAPAGPRRAESGSERSQKVEWHGAPPAV